MHPPPHTKKNPLSRDDTKEDVFVHQVSKTLLQKHYSLQIVQTSLICPFSSISYLCTAHSDAKPCLFQTAIKKNNPRKYLRSVGDGETVEFDVVEGEKVGFLPTV